MLKPLCLVLTPIQSLRMSDILKSKCFRSLQYGLGISNQISHNTCWASISDFPNLYQILEFYSSCKRMTAISRYHRKANCYFSVMASNRKTLNGRYKTRVKTICKL